MPSTLDLLDLEDKDDLERISLAAHKFDQIYADLDDSYDCRYEYSPSVPSPSEDRVESFKDRSYTLSSFASLISSSSPVRHKNQINWISVDDYVRNWSVLSKNDQSLVRMLVLSDTVTNANRFGVKKRNFESHLLLSIGADMTNIINNGRDSVLTNLMHPSTRRYSSACVENRSVDPKTCRKAYSSFAKGYDPELLLKEGFIAYQGVVFSEAISTISSEDDKERVVSFFKDNREEFSRLSNKKGKLPAYIYSNEVSVDSILEEKFKPHTHLLFFLEKEGSIENTDSKALEVEELFNSKFTDRRLSLQRIERKDELVPSSIRKADELTTMIGYLFRAYSLADQYAREITETNIEALNHKTVECYRRLLWIFKVSDTGNTIRHVNHSRIPAKNKPFNRDTLLQKKKKSSTIKKRAPLASRPEKSQSMNKKNQIIKEAIFGMKRRRNEEEALAGFRNEQGQIDPMALNSFRSMQRDPSSRGLSAGQLAQMTGNVLNEHKQYTSQLEAQQQQEAEQQINARRAQMSPGYRYSNQPKPATPAPVLRGALSAPERENDRIVQNQIAQNAQRSSAPVNPRPATEMQMSAANSGQAHHTVDQNGAIRYTPSDQSLLDQNVVKARPAAQPQQNPYLQAQQSAMQQFPELAQAGSGMNKAFLDIVNQNGGSAALQKDPALISRYAQQAQSQLAQTQPQMAQNRAPVAPQPGSSRFVGPTVPQANDENFVGPLPGYGDEHTDLARSQIKALADKHPSNANIKTAPQQASPAQTATNNQSQNPLLNSPATTSNFSGNVSLGLGGASQSNKAPTPGQPVAATNAGAQTKQSSMLEEFKSDNFEKRAEQEYLQHLREELLKMADLIYSKEQVEEFTSSRETFEKAAFDEASRVWSGMLAEMKKEGASEDFVEGFIKEAGKFTPVAQALGRAGSAIASGARGVGNAAAWLGRATVPLAKRVGSSFRFSPSQAVSGGLTGALGGTFLGGPIGTVVGGLGGAAIGGLGTGGAATLGIGGGLYAGKELGLLGSKKQKLDEFGAPRDRHRVVPFMKNKYTGAAGGAMLAHLLANESGLTGPMAWLLPIIGGIAGHRFFPQMMNKWKDPMGFGVNSVGSGANMIHQQTPLIGPPGTMS